MNCNYCNKKKQFEEEANKRIIDKSFKNQVDVMLEIDRDNLTLWCDNLEYYNKEDWFKNSDKITSKKINYCPMCGRKLGGKK